MNDPFNITAFESHMIILSNCNLQRELFGPFDLFLTPSTTNPHEHVICNIMFSPYLLKPWPPMLFDGKGDNN